MSKDLSHTINEPKREADTDFADIYASPVEWKDAMKLLEVQNLSVSYNGSRAIENVSLSLEDGEIVGLIGPNAAGKSTTLKAIAGLVKPVSGTILFRGESITYQKPHTLVKKGIVLVPQGDQRVFPHLSVLENLEIGRLVTGKPTSADDRLDEIFHLFPVLKERCRQRAGTLSGGEQQMVSIGRALMSQPRLLLLDEVLLNLAPIVTEELLSKITLINRQGVSILLVEQRAYDALRIAHRCYVFKIGRIALEGTREELLKNEVIQRTYLGRKSCLAAPLDSETLLDQLHA